MTAAIRSKRLFKTPPVVNCHNVNNTPTKDDANVLQRRHGCGRFGKPVGCDAGIQNVPRQRWKPETIHEGRCLRVSLRTSNFENLQLPSDSDALWFSLELESFWRRALIFVPLLSHPSQNHCTYYLHPTIRSTFRNSQMPCRASASDPVPIPCAI